MWREGAHVECFGEFHRCVEFLTSHCRVVEALQVDDENLRETIDRQVLLNVDLSFAAAAFESCPNHSLWLYEFFHALA